MKPLQLTTIFRKTPRLSGILLVIAAMILWGTVPVGTRLLVRNGGAFSVAFLSAARLWMAALIFVGMRIFYARRSGQSFHLPIRRTGWLFLAAAGIAFNYIFYGIGLRYTTAGATSVISQIHSVLTVLLAAMLLGESLSMSRVAGMAVAIVGVVLVVMNGSSPHDLFTSAHFYGNLIEILAAFAWPLYAIGQTKLLEESGNQQALEPIFVGAAAIVTLWLPFSGPLLLRTPTAADWLLLVFLGVGSTATAYWLFALAIQHLQTSESAMFNVLTPPIAMILGHWLLQEPFHARTILGLTLVIFGLLLILWRRHHHAPRRVRKRYLQHA